jgi:hypothetical protein
MLLTKDIPIELELLRILEIPILTLILLSSSLDFISDVRSKTIYVLVSPKPPVIL